MRRNLVILVTFLIALPAARGQGVNLSTSTAHDENIFDIYFPTADQITQFQLETSKDWDFDQLSITGTYTGAVELFRDLPARNYHVHVLSLGAAYHFENSEESEESSGELEDSASGDGETSLTPPRPPPLGDTPALTAHSDSADRFL